MSFINVTEKKYIFFSAIFAFIWFLLVLPYAIKTISAKDVVLSFLLFNVGLYVVLFIFFKSISTSTSINLGASFAVWVIYFVFDLWSPEYHVDMAGNLIAGATLGSSASDYFVGSLLQSIGLSGFPVYIGTYLGVPIILLFVASYIFPNFVRRL